VKAILSGLIKPPVGALALRGSPPVEADHYERPYLKHARMFLWVPNLLRLDHSSSIARFLLVDAVSAEHVSMWDIISWCIEQQGHCPDIP
jgi:hypothetical protein